MITGHDRWEFDESNARSSIARMTDPAQKGWFQRLYDILADGGHARVVHKARGEVDVEQFSHTFKYASYFDVCNNIPCFDISVPPRRINELEKVFRVRMEPHSPGRGQTMI